jgi:hypothetical protein
VVNVIAMTSLVEHDWRADLPIEFDLTRIGPRRAQTLLLHNVASPGFSYDPSAWLDSSLGVGRYLATWRQGRRVVRRLRIVVS